MDGAPLTRTLARSGFMARLAGEADLSVNPDENLPRS